MLATGITTFADFREGGLDGVQLAQSSLRDLRIRAVLLGRTSYHFSEDEVSDEGKGLDEPKVAELCESPVRVAILPSSVVATFNMTYGLLGVS